MNGRSERRLRRSDGSRLVRREHCAISGASARALAHANDATPAQKLQFPPEKGFFDHPEEPESRYAWRWVTYQAPDLVLQLRGGDSLTRGDGPANSLSAALAGGGSEVGAVPTVFALVRESDGPALLQQILTGAARTSRSPLHAALAERSAREPLAIARVLANRYPQNPIVSYIPSVAWANTLRLADITKDDALGAKVLEQTRPWVSGERPLFGERIALTAAAGTMIYAELAERGEPRARELAIQGAEAAARLAPNGFAQHGQGWTDDMFMTAAILARSGRIRGANAISISLPASLFVTRAAFSGRTASSFISRKGGFPGAAETASRRSARWKRSRRFRRLIRHALE